jgi:hypothetical protein
MTSSGLAAIWSACLRTFGRHFTPLECLLDEIIPISSLTFVATKPHQSDELCLLPRLKSPDFLDYLFPSEISLLILKVDRRCWIVSRIGGVVGKLGWHFDHQAAHLHDQHGK